MKDDEALDFFGYGIATCAFPFAHGNTILVTIAGQTMVPAVVLPSTRVATVVETLGH